jgi:hypothetical protein
LLALSDALYHFFKRCQPLLESRFVILRHLLADDLLDEFVKLRITQDRVSSNGGLHVLDAGGALEGLEGGLDRVGRFGRRRAALELGQQLARFLGIRAADLGKDALSLLRERDGARGLALLAIEQSGIERSAGYNVYTPISREIEIASS